MKIAETVTSTTLRIVVTIIAIATAAATATVIADIAETETFVAVASTLLGSGVAPFGLLLLLSSWSRSSRPPWQQKEKDGWQLWVSLLLSDAMMWVRLRFFCVGSMMLSLGL